MINLKAPKQRHHERVVKSRWTPQPHAEDPSIKTFDFAYFTGVPDPTFTSQAITIIKNIVAPVVSQPLLLQTLVLIFGGCCSNVYTLESILNLSSSTGTLITFLQFVFITIYTLPSQLVFWVVSPPSPPPLQPTQPVWIPRFKRRKVPLQKWMLFALQFVAINILNNAAFGYRISLPLHIILRSAGPVANMLVGYVWTGKRYSYHKVIAVVLLFVGVVLAALSDAGSKTVSSTPRAGFSDSNSTTTNSTNPIPPLADGNSTSTTAGTSSALVNQAPGFALLTLALILSAIMGNWSDGIYTKYGRNSAIADEQVFYGHLLSLPFFILQLNRLSSQWNILMAASAIAFPSSYQSADLSNHSFTAKMSEMTAQVHHQPWNVKETVLNFMRLKALPKVVILLFLNGITQIACISGVHHLSTQTSALTVSIVLNVRKVVSLLLSIVLFGNSLPVGVMVGAAVVFFGGGLYGIPDPKPAKRLGEQEIKVDGETKKDR